MTSQWAHPRGPTRKQRIDRAIRMARGITCTEKCILFVLADYANARRRKVEVWPSVSTIAADAGVSRSTAQTALHRLRDVGWLRITPQTSAPGVQTSNLYRITPPGP
jgi:hypothetical protein